MANYYAIEHRDKESDNWESYEKYDGISRAIPTMELLAKKYPQYHWRVVERRIFKRVVATTEEKQ